MKILLLDDGNRGNFIQSYGIAKEFIPSSLEISKVNLKGPKYKLPGRKGKYPLLVKLLNIFCFFGLFKYGEKFLKLLMKEKINLKEKYNFIISAGSLLAPVNVILSKTCKAKSIQIMVPSGIPLKLFDFLIIPYHDFARMKFKKRKNFIITLGAPNYISEELLEEGRRKLQGLIG
ncbi:mitochondrial fission ELM1 family protein [bacterium]|nr:mitochondrial fission ELM1 family protein [bacterium]